MSETAVPSMTALEPQPVYLKDYQVSAYLIDEIELHFDLRDKETLVKSHLRIRHNRLNPDKTKTLILNGEELILESIKIDGQALSASAYEVTDKFLKIHEVPDSFELEIVTKIFPEQNTALSGLYRSAKTYCTQCEAEGFRRITYFLDRPDILARYKTTIVADQSYKYLLSNGNLVASGKTDDGRHFATWEDPFKKPSYLFALVAGDFDLLEDKFKTQSGNDIALRIYVEKGYGDQSHHAMYSVKEAMSWDEKAYGREYDLDIYMIVAIGDFNMGAMENKGLNIFNTKYVLAKPETATDDDYIHILSVIGHEYFHNWSGNRVTCRDWFQLSLKEGLTIFRDQSFSEDVLSAAVMRIHEVNALRESQFPEDAGPLAHPVRPDSYLEINNFYTSTIYNKGAEVLRMQQTILGKPMFRKGMDLYFARHDGQAVTIEDFVKTMEDVSGVDLKQFRLWYSQAGTPIVHAEDEYNAEQKTYTLKLKQTCPQTPGQTDKKAMYIPIRMGLLDASGQDVLLQLNNEEPTTEKVLAFTEKEQTFQFKNVASRPVPSLLRHFSAPVILHYAYTDTDLAFLVKHDSDAFNRWNAWQRYAVQTILGLVEDYRQGKALQLSKTFIETFQYTLQHDKGDKFLQAEMLLLPSEKYIGEQMECVDVDGIHAAREFVLHELSKASQSLLLTVYEANAQKGAYHFGMQEVGERQVRNRALAYLTLLPENSELAMKQFEASLSVNMTNTVPALIALANMDSPLRQSGLEKFYTTWKQDALVMDKWLAIQAASKLPDTLVQVKSLMEHPAFDIKNPNKVYSLIGAFGRNLIHFHAIDGSGYEFLSHVVRQLDHLNPQVAARMVTPLTAWRRYDKTRQSLMREQLAWLSKDAKISMDLYELVTKSLE